MGRTELLIVVMVALLAAACSGDDASVEDTTTTVTTTAVTTTTAAVEETTTSVAPATTTTMAATRTPTDTVVEFYASLNAEDPERLVAAWPTVDPDLAGLLTEGLRLRLSVTCRPDSSDANVVGCTEEYVRHEFFVPAGVSGPIEVRMTTADGVVTDREVSVRPSAFEDYVEAVGAWLETAHPDVFDSSYQGEGEYPFSTVDQFAEVGVLLPDFFAQSDVYPIGG